MKKCVEIYVMLFKNWKLLFENTNQTPPMFAKIEKYNNEYIQWGGGLWSNYGVNDSKNLVFQFQSYKGEGILESRGSLCCECPAACSENTDHFSPLKKH